MNPVQDDLETAPNGLRELAVGELPAVEGGMNMGWANAIVRMLAPIIYGGTAPYQPPVDP